MENETKTRILECAQTEFAEKGFMRASLRSICKNAGVTTGALYFFFKDKEDLFASLVKEPLEKVNAILLMHYQKQRIRMQEPNLKMEDFVLCMDKWEQILPVLYAYRECFLLLLTKAQGSSLETIRDSFVAIEQKENELLAGEMERRFHILPVEAAVLRWISQLHVGAFVDIVVQMETETDALTHLNRIFPYLASGWRGIFGIKKESENIR